MKVLVCGGAGYVGGAVTDTLLYLKHIRDIEIMVYDALLYEESYRKAVPFTYGDVRDTNKLAPWVEWADVVIWLAALVGDGACELHPEISAEINALSVKWLVDNFPDKRIIFTSTCSVYGYQENFANERSALNPLSVYAITKIRAEEYLAGKNAIIFRLGTLYGVGDEFSRIRLDLVVNTMTVKAVTEGEIHVYGGEQYRPLLHVDNVAHTICKHIDTSYTGVYNLTDFNYRMSELALEIQSLVPDTKVVVSETIGRDGRSYWVNNNLARDVLGFVPYPSLERGVLELYNLLREGRIKDLDNPRYTNQKYLSMFNTHLEW
jgi:nucleoside-diphosphate-sugar epimerase